MSESWFVMKPRQVKGKKFNLTDDSGNIVGLTKEKDEHCCICSTSSKYLIGYYGTCNERGCFYGICPDCLKRLSKMWKIFRKTGISWEYAQDGGKA